MTRSPDEASAVSLRNAPLAFAAYDAAQARWNYPLPWTGGRWTRTGTGRPATS